MDSELEEKIDALIQKAHKDLKTRIVREVSKSLNKSIKDQARELKSNNSSSSKHKKHVASPTKEKKSSRRKNDDSDYYDE
jgi:hypothetical protein